MQLWSRPHLPSSSKPKINIYTYAHCAAKWASVYFFMKLRSKERWHQDHSVFLTFRFCSYENLCQLKSRSIKLLFEEKQESELWSCTFHWHNVFLLISNTCTHTSCSRDGNHFRVTIAYLLAYDLICSHWVTHFPSIAFTAQSSHYSASKDPVSILLTMTRTLLPCVFKVPSPPRLELAQWPRSGQWLRAQCSREVKASSDTSYFLFSRWTGAPGICCIKIPVWFAGVFGKELTVSQEGGRRGMSSEVSADSAGTCYFESKVT